MSFNTVMAAGTSKSSDVEMSEREAVAVELLDALGIYEGVDSIDGKEAFVRRDVMAFLAARIMGLSNVTHDGESFFSDVDKSNFAFNAINVLAQMDVVKGDSAGKFNPTKDITLDEATEIILRVMGYAQLLEAHGTGMCKNLAGTHKLHKGIVTSKDKRLQVKNLSLLLYNTLIADFPHIVSMSQKDGIEYRVKKGESLLSEIYEVYEVEGVISGNAHTSVNINDGVGNGWVQIGKTIYNVGKTDANKYVGYYMKGYYHEGDVNTLLCVDVESNNTVVEFSSYNTQYNNFKYTTYVNDKKKVYDVSKGLNLIYNGKAIYYDKNKMVPQYGTIKLINNNKDKAYDTVVISNVRNIVVGGYGATSQTIQSKYDGVPLDLSDMDETMYSIHKADGKPYKLATLKEWDILSVLESDDGEYLDITVTSESFTGTVEGINDDDGITVLTIDGKKYEVASTFRNNSNYDIKFEYSGTFYLDMYGRIAAANGNISQIKWGYLIKVRKNTGGAYDCLNIKLLGQDSSNVLRLETAEKFYINDVKYVSSDINNLTLSEYQVVRYSLDKDGKLKKLYTVGNDFIQMEANSSRGFVSNVFVANQVMDIAVDSETVFLQVPNRAAGDDLTDESFYGVMPLSSFVRDSWYTVSSYGFDIDEVTAPMVLVERLTSTAATPSGTYMVISDIHVGLNKDNEVVDKIIGYDSAKNKVEILAREQGVAARYGIEEGDFFAMVLYPDGTLQRAVQIHDYKTGSFNSSYNGRDYNQTNFGRFGYAYDMSSNMLLLSSDASAFTGKKVLNTSSATILIVDSTDTRDMVKVGSLSDIMTYKQSGRSAKIVFYGSNSVPRVIVSYQ